MEENSSSEDFEYLEDRLKQTGTLPKETMLMLRSIVSNTYKDRKYPGRFDRGQDYKGASDEEGHIDEIDGSKKQNDSDIEL